MSQNDPGFLDPEIFIRYFGCYCSFSRQAKNYTVLGGSVYFQVVSDVVYVD